MNDSLRQLLKARDLEQRKPATPERRILLGAIEAAIVLADLAEKADERNYPKPTVR